jgi:small-conductance mechanosensitive channel
MFQGMDLSRLSEVIVILGGTALCMVLFGLISRFLIRKSGRALEPGLATRIVQSSKGSIQFFILSQGMFLAISAVPAIGKWNNSITVIWTTLLSFQIAYLLNAMVGAVVNWYLIQVAPKTTMAFDDTALPILRRVLAVVIYGVAVMIALDTAGISISPLLGGLGISGLAVALALQPTLSNFFAGTYILADRAIEVGNYIQIQGGPEGYVTQVGWRSTKMRTWLNNLVVIPNSSLADAIVMNYNSPDTAVNVIVTCGVSYSSDLGFVERISLEVARQVIAITPEAEKEMEPWFGYDRFGDSNINFWIFVQAKDRIGSFVVTSQLIKGLHSRFLTEGIEINYPVRKIVSDLPWPV